MTTRRRLAVEARGDVLDDLRIEGLNAAYRRAIKLLEDDTAPATAHASLIRCMFDAGGLLRADQDDEREKELHEMTADEVAVALRQAQADIESRRQNTGLFD
ncbi:hypothetical protein [Methylopila sp. M107]|uniref:hypothetical protein n=1 Tax=Methylopila sp. M107 TaxID=1101190 RepID=UPI000371008B|nr:hypothetical protein [Methylopila sp. M107]